MSDLPIESQIDGGQLIEDVEVAREFPNGTLDSNGHAPSGKRRESGGTSTGAKAKATGCI
jgi:hypothetical protein